MDEDEEELIEPRCGDRRSWPPSASAEASSPAAGMVKMPEGGGAGEGDET